MLRFKQYLKERAPAWTESLSTMLFDVGGGIGDLPIPMSSPIFKRIWPDSIRSRVFHLTDFNGIEKLSKMQGKKKSISAFYNIDPARIDYGIQTEGGYVLELDADVLAAAPDDIASMPDKTGRRWLIWNTVLYDMGGGSKIKKMEKDLEELLMDLVMKYAEDPGRLGMPNIIKSWMGLGKESKSDGKLKSLIIKDYLDGMEKIMKKYSKPLRSVFTDYTKKRTQGEIRVVDGQIVQTTSDWDELVVNNFQIKKVHVGETYSDEDWTKDDFPAPYRIWTDNTALAKHISSIAKKGI